MPAFSVPASEHSTMTMWGKEGEEEAFRVGIKLIYTLIEVSSMLCYLRLSRRNVAKFEKILRLGSQAGIPNLP
jgi:hypothetical protein